MQEGRCVFHLLPDGSNRRASARRGAFAPRSARTMAQELLSESLSSTGNVPPSSFERRTFPTERGLFRDPSRPGFRPSRRSSLGLPPLWQGDRPEGILDGTRHRKGDSSQIVRMRGGSGWRRMERILFATSSHRLVGGIFDRGHLPLRPRRAEESGLAVPAMPPSPLPGRTRSKGTDRKELEANRRDGLRFNRMEGALETEPKCATDVSGIGRRCAAAARWKWSERVRIGRREKRRDGAGRREETYRRADGGERAWIGQRT